MRSAGPLEVLVMEFAGEGLPDGAGAALEWIQENDDVRIVEAYLVMKTGTGAVHAEEVTDLVGLDAIGTGLGLGLPDVSLWMDQDTVTEVGDAMGNGRTALALVLEHHSARDVLTAFRDLGGRVLATTRLPTVAGQTPVSNWHRPGPGE